MLACSSTSASTKKILAKVKDIERQNLLSAVPSWGQGFVSHLDRPGDAPHYHVKVLLDEPEVGDIEGEVLHEAGGDGVGVRC